MWRWPQNWQLKKHNQFWLKLIGFSVLGHLIVLGLVFFSYKKTNLKLTVCAKTRKNIEVVFMPMYKKIDQKTVGLLSDKKASPTVAKKQAVKKPAIKPVEKKSKPEVKKNTKKVEPKIKKKVIDQVKKKTPDKPKVIKPESKNIPKQPELKTESKLESKLKELPVQESVVHEPIYLGRQDLKDFQLMNELESVLVQNWQPPIGFDAQVECVVEIVVGSAGEIIDLVIKKSSNILAYDMAVRRNLSGIILPKSASNKTLTVVFRP